VKVVVCKTNSTCLLGFDAALLGPRATLTDGLRLDFTGDEVLHLRSSGNARECRLYVHPAPEPLPHMALRW
jgi:phosphomannomutase